MKATVRDAETWTDISMRTLGPAVDANGEPDDELDTANGHAIAAANGATGTADGAAFAEPTAGTTVEVPGWDGTDRTPETDETDDETDDEPDETEPLN